jgi:branched-chain amino acid transport system substrate-binding protein
VKKHISLLVVACAVVAALCGSVTAASASTRNLRTSEAPIPVGAIGSWSGVNASSVGIGEQVMYAWADSVNAAGGIDGHHIQLYMEDDQGNAQISVTEVKRLVEQDHVVAIVGEAAAPGDATWASYIQSTGIPVIGGTSNDLIFTKNPDYYAAAGGGLGDFYGIAKIARTDGTKTAALYCAEDPDCAAVKTLVTEFGKPLGLQVPLSIAVSATAADYTAVCQKLKQSGVQSYILGLAVSTIKRLVAQCEQQGVTAKLIIPNVADESFASIPTLNGLKVADITFPFFADSTPATKAYQAALKKYAPSIGNGTDRPLNSFSAITWASGELFEAAVKAAGSGPITAASIKRGLYALKGDTLGGLAPPITFTKGKAEVSDCYFQYEISNGHYEAPSGLTPTCVSPAKINALMAAG